jgi:hypothetical protein
MPHFVEYSCVLVLAAQSVGVGAEQQAHSCRSAGPASGRTPAGSLPWKSVVAAIVAAIEETILDEGSNECCC